MATEISFCPLCAGKLEAQDDGQYTCVDCETEFFIEIVSDDDDDDEEDEDDDEGDKEKESEDEEDDDEY
jgi:hypothetical protein